MYQPSQQGYNQTLNSLHFNDPNQFLLPSSNLVANATATGNGASGSWPQQQQQQDQYGLAAVDPLQMHVDSNPFYSQPNQQMAGGGFQAPTSGEMYGQGASGMQPMNNAFLEQQQLNKNQSPAQAADETMRRGLRSAEGQQQGNYVNNPEVREGSCPGIGRRLIRCVFVADKVGGGEE